MADETKQVSVLCGPYQSKRLTMTAADADAAVAAHWARDAATPYGDHEPLSEAERTAALEAATAWAHDQWVTAGIIAEPPPTEPPPPEGRRRAMAAEQPAGYTTREAPKPK